MLYGCEAHAQAHTRARSHRQWVSSRPHCMRSAAHAPDIRLKAQRFWAAAYRPHHPSGLLRTPRSPHCANEDLHSGFESPAQRVMSVKGRCSLSPRPVLGAAGLRIRAQARTARRQGLCAVSLHAAAGAKVGPARALARRGPTPVSPRTRGPWPLVARRAVPHGAGRGAWAGTALRPPQRFVASMCPAQRASARRCLPPCEPSHRAKERGKGAARPLAGRRPDACARAWAQT